MTSIYGQLPQPAPSRPPQLSRRLLLAGGIGVASLGVWGMANRLLAEGTPTDEHQSPKTSQGKRCVDKGRMMVTQKIGGARLRYEEDGRLSDFRFDPNFHKLLIAWLADWNATSRYKGTTDIWSLGAYVEGGSNCASMHAAGRAFDLTSLRAGNRMILNAREDQIRTGNGQQQAAALRRYWTLVASLNLHFSYVLHYRYDNAHRNHIHIDNLVSESGLSTFDSDSEVQNQSVQAICAAIWGRPGEITTNWSQTQDRVRPVLDELGISNLKKQDTWHVFLRASVARG